MLTEARLTELADAARSARRNAYVPYSGFDAGAAVLTTGDDIYSGALVENLVFGLAMCAERVALFQAVTQGGGRPVALALAAPDTAGDVTFPCGSCLQVAAELGGKELAIAAVPEDGSPPQVKTVLELAPGLPYRKTLLT